jgi:alpha-acetolactate decarboxylase
LGSGVRGVRSYASSKMKQAIKTVALVAAILAGCATTPEREPFAQVKCWGSMREVLREGKSHQRVQIESVTHKGTWGLGVLTEMEGEITIVDGQAALAVVENGVLTHRALSERDGATLLVLSTVEEWSEQDLPEVRTLGDLQFVIEAALAGSAIKPEEGPVPIRIEGGFERMALHVLDHSCPIANPEGPKPWRWAGAGATGSIVGIYAKNQGGVLTHHGQEMHLHGVVITADGERLSGHLDEIKLGPDARLFLPVPSEH